MHEVQGSSPCETTIMQDSGNLCTGILYFFAYK